MGLTTTNRDPSSADPTTEPQGSDQTTTTDTTTTAATSSSSNDPSSLPPAALDLAAQLFDLARQGETAALSEYIAAGIPPNLTNSTGDTLLMLAAYHGHHETVRSLMGAGADPNALNGRGQSPIAGAVFKGHDEVVRVLFEGGAKVEDGRPNAVETARMFRRRAACDLFGVEMGEAGAEGMPPGMVPGGPQ